MHVDFFIAGVQKSGTTALDAMLRRHSAIQMAAKKEPHFFDNEAMDWTRVDFTALHALYDCSRPALMHGEATPIYTYWPRSLERIKAYNPRAKLIVGLRHPAFRAFSHWRMETSRAADDLDFATAIREGRERVRNADDGVHRVYSYVERGFYAGQIKRLFSLFPQEQVCFFRTDRLWEEPATTLEGILRFLGAPPAPLTLGFEYIVPAASRTDVALAAQDLQYLGGLFAADIEETASLAGLDCSDWLSNSYAEPMPSESPSRA